MTQSKFLQCSIRRASDVDVCVLSSCTGGYALMRYTSPAFLPSPHFNRRPIVRPGIQWSTHLICVRGNLVPTAIIHHPLHFASSRPSAHRDDLALAVIRNCTETHQDHVYLCDGVWVQEEVSRHWSPVRVSNLATTCPKELRSNESCTLASMSSQLGCITRSLVFSAPISTLSRSHEMPGRSKPCSLAHPRSRSP